MKSSPIAYLRLFLLLPLIIHPATASNFFPYPSNHRHLPFSIQPSVTTLFTNEQALGPRVAAAYHNLEDIEPASKIVHLAQQRIKENIPQKLIYGGFPCMVIGLDRSVLTILTVGGIVLWLN